MSAALIAWMTRFFIRPGEDVTRIPRAAPRITMNSDGWIRTGKCPPASAKPPAIAPKTIKIPTMTLPDSADRRAG